MLPSGVLGLGLAQLRPTVVCVPGHPLIRRGRPMRLVLTWPLWRPPMRESEEPDAAASPAMRRVFEELEAEFEAGLRREAEQEALSAVRAELGATVL
jgi:hypothetical protein